MVKIVLLGSLPKGDKARKDWADWKQAYIEVFSREIPSVEFTHGDAISDNAGPELVVGHDLAQVKLADICVVDAREKIGAGTAQEMVLAKYFNKPVVSVIPKDSHHRKSHIEFHGVVIDEWIHPFLVVSSDYVAESIEDAAIWVKEFLDSPKDTTVKNLSIFNDAIEQFELYAANKPGRPKKI